MEKTVQFVLLLFGYWTLCRNSPLRTNIRPLPTNEPSLFSPAFSNCQSSNWTIWSAIKSIFFFIIASRVKVSASKFQRLTPPIQSNRKKLSLPIWREIKRSRRDTSFLFVLLNRVRVVPVRRRSRCDWRHKWVALLFFYSMLEAEVTVSCFEANRVEPAVSNCGIAQNWTCHFVSSIEYNTWAATVC